jgi:hypothetical protein
MAIPRDRPRYRGSGDYNGPSFNSKSNSSILIIIKHILEKIEFFRVSLESQKGNVGPAGFEPTTIWFPSWTL